MWQTPPPGALCADGYIRQENRGRGPVHLRTFGIGRTTRARTFRRTAAARLHCHDRCPRRPVMLLDEPTSFLDVSACYEVMDLMRLLRDKHGKTIVTVLHDIDMALRYSDEICVMREGRLLAQGPPCDHDVLDGIEAAFGRAHRTPARQAWQRLCAIQPSLRQPRTPAPTQASRTGSACRLPSWAHPRKAGSEP